MISESVQWLTLISLAIAVAILFIATRDPH